MFVTTLERTLDIDIGTGGDLIKFKQDSSARLYQMSLNYCVNTTVEWFEIDPSNGVKQIMTAPFQCCLNSNRKMVILTPGNANLLEHFLSHQNSSNLLRLTFF